MALGWDVSAFLGRAHSQSMSWVIWLPSYGSQSTFMGVVPSSLHRACEVAITQPRPMTCPKSPSKLLQCSHNPCPCPFCLSQPSL